MSIVATVGQLDLVDDVGAAEWLTSRMHESPPDVCAIVPTEFAAYARILHPAYQYSVGSGEMTRRLSWAEIAAETGRSVHAGTEWESIRPRESRSGEPAIGTLSSECAELLSAFLASYTATSGSCWYGMWVGRQPLLIPDGIAPTFSLPLRDMYLLHGSVWGLKQNLAPTPLQSRPNISWPEDRSWVLATDIDLRTTYLAGNVECVDALLHNSDVEAFAVRPTDLVWVDQ